MMGEMLHNQGDGGEGCDVLLVGEQTAHVVRLAAGLVRQGLRPAVLNGPALCRAVHDEYDFEIPNFTVAASRMPLRYKLPTLQRIEQYLDRQRLRELLERINPGVIHLNYIKPEHAVFAELGEGCPPLVSTVWGTDIHTDAVCGDEQIRDQLVRVLLHSQVVTADSVLQLRRARGVVPQKPQTDFRLVMWGVDVELFRFGKNESDARIWREQLQIPEDSPVVLAPRRIHERYSPERVVRAFAASRTGRRGFLVFKLFGDNPETEAEQQAKLHRLASELNIEDRIRFAPVCPYGSLPSLFAMAEVACFFLDKDGTPSTALELMACGVPMVASNIADYEGILHHESTAYLVDRESASLAGEAIDHVVENRESLGPMLLHGRRWVETHANFRQMVQQFCATYAQACAKASVGG